MRSNLWTGVLGKAAGVAGVATLIFTYGCGGFQAQAASPAQAAGPVLVSCEPNQRALVRPAATNGTAISQVECVSADPSAAQPVGYVQPASFGTSRPIALEPAAGSGRVVPISSYPASTVRPARTVQADERPVRRVERTRSVQKSAVIIGSSAGVGAGLGAAMGGKKGALVGALVGGGGAALWDQITRR